MGQANYSGAIVVLFYIKANIKETSKVNQLAKFHNKAKKAGSNSSFLGAFASCLHNLNRLQ